MSSVQFACVVEGREETPRGRGNKGKGLSPSSLSSATAGTDSAGLGVRADADWDEASRTVGERRRGGGEIRRMRA